MIPRLSGVVSVVCIIDYIFGRLGLCSGLRVGGMSGWLVGWLE